ncbi:MAG TPA: hypothetical protein VHL34_24885 [Rhizomicrobium sp.]|jgi:hypothetical protein|nr:hypothetical protein [Rhizomicrobium sp.]
MTGNEDGSERWPTDEHGRPWPVNKVKAYRQHTAPKYGIAQVGGETAFAGSGGGGGACGIAMSDQSKGDLVKVGRWTAAKSV